jgi:hypothetical protein
MEMIGLGLFCRTKRGIYGSVVGKALTDMMVNHLQLLQQKMAYLVIWLPEL